MTFDEVLVTGVRRVYYMTPEGVERTKDLGAGAQLATSREAALGGYLERLRREQAQLEARVRAVEAAWQTSKRT